MQWVNPKIQNESLKSKYRAINETSRTRFVLWLKQAICFTLIDEPDQESNFPRAQRRTTSDRNFTEPFRGAVQHLRVAVTHSKKKFSEQVPCFSLGDHGSTRAKNKSTSGGKFRRDSNGQEKGAEKLCLEDGRVRQAFNVRDNL